MLGVAGGAFALFRGRPPGAHSTEGPERTLTVQPRPFSATVSVVGTIIPGDNAPVIAPFDGVVRQMAFEYGRPVTAGQVLVVMDPFELEQRRREAESNYLKADQTESDMASWTKGPEVSRAQRAVTSAELSLADPSLVLDRADG